MASGAERPRIQLNPRRVSQMASNLVFRFGNTRNIVTIRPAQLIEAVYLSLSICQGVSQFPFGVAGRPVLLLSLVRTLRLDADRAHHAAVLVLE